MLKILYLVTIIFVYILELVSNKSRKNIFTILICSYLIFLMGGSLDNPDTLVYSNIYGRDFFNKDIGFGILIYALKSIGCTLNLFRLIVSILGIVLIHSTVKKFVKNTGYFFILYALYPFMFDIVQVRNFLAMSLFIYAVPSLLEQEKRYLLKYIIIVCIAATMQKTAIVYLPLIFVRNLNKKKFTKYIISFVIICSIFTGLFRNFLVTFSTDFLSSISDDLTGLSNYLNVNTNWGWIVFWGEQVGNFVLVLWAGKIINNALKKREANKFYSRKTISFSKLMYDINLYMFVFLPLFVLDENYTRIIRNVMPLNLMVYCIATNMIIHNNRIDLKKDNGRDINGILFITLTLLYQLLLLYMLCKTYWYNIVVAVFSHNWILL